MIKYVFNDKTDPRGSLVALEGNHEIPFSIKRVYYMYNIKEGASRGCHAHKKLQQLLICINGQCSILLDNGLEKQEIVLSKKTEGIYIPPGIWHEIHACTTDVIIISLASDYYDESDYIRNYDDFRKCVAVKKEGLL